MSSLQQCITARAMFKRSRKMKGKLKDEKETNFFVYNRGAEYARKLSKAKYFLLELRN